MGKSSSVLSKLKWLFMAVAAVILVAFVGLYVTFRASLPALDGTMSSSSLDHNVLLERDKNGNATLTAENRGDLAYATGFLHSQERFFQMDLSRRLAAGELSELFGPLALNMDRGKRLHRFRVRARAALDNMPQYHRDLLKKYVKGVNDGLKDLASKPFEYWLLQQDPAPWSDEDTVLVIYSMFLSLQEGSITSEEQRFYLEKSLDPRLAKFLLPYKTEWDAPLQKDENPWTPQEIPPSTVVQSHKMGLAFMPKRDDVVPGSNNWSVSGKLTKTGAAMLSNDMHLGIRAPGTWFRLRLKLKDDSIDVSGVSLPGAPLIIAGSNGNVAWGYTNSFVDTSDFIELKINPENDQQYLTPAGYVAFTTHQEKIKVKGADPEIMEIRDTIWGPVYDMDNGQHFALKWVAHDPAAVNMGLISMEKVTTVEEAMKTAPGNGIPAQNAMLVDAQGNIGWINFGALPKRRPGDYGRPGDWSRGVLGWDGWLNFEERPKIYNPANNRLWSANSRIVSGEDYKLVGDGGADIGARQQQIRDDLMALGTGLVEKDLYAIQLDNRAVFWQRWQKQLVAVLKKTDDPEFSPFLKDVENWGGRAEISSVGFRLVKNYRTAVFEGMLGYLTAPCIKKFRSCDYERASHQMESPLWRIVDQRPDGWLPTDVKGGWQAFFEGMARHAWAPVFTGKVALKNYIWGEQNRSSIRHPLSRSVPLLGLLTDMPKAMQNGVHQNMPHISGHDFGQSERIVVSPGHEEDGIMNMPAGQSGHPLSPYYGAGHDDWLTGKPTPFLPGKTKWSLKFVPAS